MISKLFQLFISRVTSETEIETISTAERVLKLFPNHFSDNENVGKYSKNNFEMTPGKLPRAEIKLIISDGRRRRLK